MNFAIGARKGEDGRLFIPGSISYRPDCYIRFFRFKIRDTLDQRSVINISPDVNIPGVVHNVEVFDTTHYMDVQTLDAHKDVLTCRVTKSKANAAGSFEMQLAPGNINYFNAIHPGDQVLIFMKRSEITEIDNSPTSGLKMYGVIENVRKRMTTDAQGRKTLRYIISGSDFGYFFNTEVYYNPILADPIAKDQFGALYNSLGAQFSLEWVGPHYNVNALMNAFLGKSRNKIKYSLDESVEFEASPNRVLRIPKEVHDFFSGTEHAGDIPSVSDVLYRNIGVLKYSPSVVGPSWKYPLSGLKFIKIDPGNEYTIWSILQNYSNRPMNEMYLDLELANGPDNEPVIAPTFTLRQYPWTNSEEIEREVELFTTLFTELPKFAISEGWIFAENAGKSNKVRFNYIQIFGFGTANVGQPLQHDFQTFLGNFAIDKTSISRYGLNVMKIDSDYDIDSDEILKNISLDSASEASDQTDDFFSLDAFSQKPLSQSLLFESRSTEARLDLKRSEFFPKIPRNKANISLVPKWAKIYADWHLNAHQWVNASWQTVGIEEPITLGMNMEVIRSNGVRELHHVESYTHTYNVDPSGAKTFRSSLNTVRGRLSDGRPVHADINTAVIHDNIGVTNTEKDPSQVDQLGIERSGRNETIEGNLDEILNDAKEDGVGV